VRTKPYQLQINDQDRAEHERDRKDMKRFDQGKGHRVLTDGVGKGQVVQTLKKSLVDHGGHFR
jgi:hypothetical protein